MRMRTNIDLNNKSFAFLDSFHFKTTEWCIAHRYRTSKFLSSIPSLVNATSRSACLNDTSPICIEYWTGFLERWSTSILKLLIFIPAMSHAVVNPFVAFRRPDFVEASKTKSSAKGRLTFYSITTH